MTQIICFAGEKQSGKNTSCNFVLGLKMMDWNVCRQAQLNDGGELLVSDIYGQTVADMPFFPIKQPYVNVDMLNADLHQHGKIYAFADYLKIFLRDILGLDHKMVFGTDKDKNSKTSFRWQNMPMVITDNKIYKGLPAEAKRALYFHKPGFMTARELMQFFGTELCRGIHTDIWIDSLLRQISKEAPEIALISDCRFDNEIEKVQKAGGFVVGLTKKIDNDDSTKKHKSEQVDLNKCDVVIDNQDLSITETNKLIFNAISHLDCIPVI